MVCANELPAWRIPMDSWGNLLRRWTFTEHRRIRHSEACRHRPDSVQSEHTHRPAWTVSFLSQSDVHRVCIVDAGICLSGALRVDAAGCVDGSGSERLPSCFPRSL